MRARCVSEPPGLGVGVPAFARNRNKLGTLGAVKCKSVNQP